jgi:hypothetical protein
MRIFIFISIISNYKCFQKDEVKKKVPDEKNEMASAKQ